MSLIGYEGFDHQSSFLNVQIRQGPLQWYNNPIANANQDNSWSATGGRFGTGGIILFNGAASFGSSSNWWGFYSNTDPTSIVGFAMSGFGPDYYPVNLYFRNAEDANAEQIHFVITQGPSRIQAYRGATLLGSSAINIFSVGSFAYFEFKVVTNNATGSVEARVNGQTVLLVTGIDTQQSTNAWCSAFEFNTRAHIHLDDFYVCNGINLGGTYPCNDFLGDVRVETTFPIANAAVSWTPLANTNWVEVSEHVFDGDASYNYTDVVGERDQFNLGAIDTSITVVIAVQATGAYRKEGGGTHAVKQEISSSGTVGASAAIPLSADFQYYSSIFMTDPATATAWTTSAVNSMLAGYTLDS